jgi:glutathione S-transferase
MKLFTTLTSPYGRIARIVVIERGLSERVAIEVPLTRQPDSPYYAINASGRVPYLQVDEHTGLEDSSLICRYLDHLEGAPIYEPPSGEGGWVLRRLEANARSMVDGVNVWGREYLYRSAEFRSETIISHEHARANRMVAQFETQTESKWLSDTSGELNMAQIILSALLHGREDRPPGFNWSDSCPRLAALISKIGERDSLKSTLPPS